MKFWIAALALSLAAFTWAIYDAQGAAAAILYGVVSVVALVTVWRVYREPVDAEQDAAAKAADEFIASKRP